MHIPCLLLIILIVTFPSLVVKRKFGKISKRIMSMLVVTYFARKINETETIASELCYIKDLIFVENSIV